MKTEFSKDFIGIFDNSINSETLNEMLEWFDVLMESGYSQKVYGTRDENIIENNNDENTISDTYNPTDRNDISVQWPNNIVSSTQLNIFLVKKYHDIIKECFIRYVKNYGLTFTENYGILGFKMHKVSPSQGYHAWHYENMSLNTLRRVMAFMTYLTIPEEGGETEFLYQSIRINPVVGRTLIWPAGYTHYHRGNPPLKGNKIYATGWIEMIDQKADSR